MKISTDAPTYTNTGDYLEIHQCNKGEYNMEIVLLEKMTLPLLTGILHKVAHVRYFKFFCKMVPGVVALDKQDDQLQVHQKDKQDDLPAKYRKNHVLTKKLPQEP